MRATVCSVVMSAILLGSTGVSTAEAAGRGSTAWVNSDGFSKACLGYSDNYPSALYAQAQALFSVIGFSGGPYVIGHGFTRNAFLAGYRYSFGVYVHSHADIYNSSSIQAAFLQDPPAGYCNSYTRDYISAAQVKANAIPPYNLVIMSTCYLGAMYQPHTGSGHPNYMPEAFGFTKTHGTTGSRFYVGYVYSTYDSAQYKFEGEMLRWLQLFPTDTLYSAWTYAAANSYSYPSASDPFQAAWFGDMNYRPKG